MAQLGATFLTVHAYPQTMKAAVAAKGNSGLKILAVTVLTSYDDADLFAAGYKLGVGALVAQRARQARDRKRRRAGVLGGGGGQFAQDRRARHGAGHAGHPPCRQRNATTRSAS